MEKVTKGENMLAWTILFFVATYASFFAVAIYQLVRDWPK